MDGAQLVFRYHAGKLKVLVGGHNVVIPALEQRHQVIVGLACGTFILHVTHSGQERPVCLRGRITVVKAIECANKSIFSVKISQVLLKYRIVLIKEVEAAGSGHTRRSAHQNCVGLSNFFQQDLHILAVDGGIYGCVTVQQHS